MHLPGRDRIVGATGAFCGRTADTHGLHELAIFMIFMIITAVVFIAVTVLDRSLRRVGTFIRFTKGAR